MIFGGSLRANVRGRAGGWNGRKLMTGGPIRTGNRGTRPGPSLFPPFALFIRYSLPKRPRDHAVANNTAPAFGSVWEAERTDKIKLFQKPRGFPSPLRRIRLFLSHYSLSSSRSRGSTSSFSTLDSLLPRRVRLSPFFHSFPLSISFSLSLYFADAISQLLPPLGSAHSHPPPDSLICRLVLSKFALVSLSLSLALLIPTAIRVDAFLPRTNIPWDSLLVLIVVKVVLYYRSRRRTTRPLRRQPARERRSRLHIFTPALSAI